MQTARVTVLMTPDRKAAIEASALRLGVSSGEYIRLAVDKFAPDRDEEAELAALVAEVNRAVPAMRASLDRSAKRLEATHAELDTFLRKAGVRR